MRIRLSRRIQLALLALAGLALVAGGIAFASIPDSNQVIHGCYVKSGGNLRVIDSTVTNCKASETALNWSQSGPKGATGATGAMGTTGAAGATGATGPGVDLAAVYSVNSGVVHVPASTLGTVDADCNPGDVAVGGNLGVNGPSNFSIYFAGTHIIPANIGSATMVAGYYSFTISNDNASENIIFATVYCVAA
jgi:hypothetical protein